MSANVDWNDYALYYDALLGLSPYRDMLSEVVQKTKTAPGQKVLDASCGTGNFIVEHGSTHKGAHYVGVDQSVAMLERAKNKCVNVSNCSFFQTNLDETLPFTGEEFDLVVSINTLYAVARPEFTLREFFRAIKPGGRMVLVNPTDTIENGLILKKHARSTKPDSYWHNLHQSSDRERALIKEAVGDKVTAERLIQVADHNRKIAEEQSFHSIAEDKLRELLCTAGFGGINIKTTYAGQAYLVEANKE